MGKFFTFDSRNGHILAQSDVELGQSLYRAVFGTDCFVWSSFENITLVNLLSGESTVVLKAPEDILDRCRAVGVTPHGEAVFLQEREPSGGNNAEEKDSLVKIETSTGMENWRQRFDLSFSGGDSREIYVANDGNLLVGGRTIQLVDSQSGKVLSQAVAGKESIPGSLSTSADGKHALAYSFFIDAPSASVVSIPALKPDWVLRRKTDSVENVKISRDGKSLLVMNELKHGQLINWATGQIKPQSETDKVDGLQFRSDWAADATKLSDDWKLAAARNSGGWDILDVSSGVLVTHLPLGDDSIVLGFSPSSNFVTAVANGRLLILNLKTGARVYEKAVSNITGVWLTKDESKVIRGENGTWYTSPLGNPSEEKILLENCGTVIPVQDRELMIGIDPDAGLFNMASGEKLREFRGHTDRVYCAAVDPTGHSLATGSEDRSIRVFDMGSGKCTFAGSQHWGAVRTVVWSPNGKHLLSGSEDGTMAVWSLKRGFLAQLLIGNDGSWLVVDRNGNYDSSSGMDTEDLHWVNPQGQILTVKQLGKARFRPGVFASILGSD